MPAIWRSFTVSATGSAAALAFGLLAPAAFADDGSSGPPSFFMTWDASADGVDPFTYNPTEFGTSPTVYGTWQMGSGSPTLGNPGPERISTGWRYRGELTGSNNSWALSWDCIANADPFVDATINVTNMSNVTQTFWVDMPLLIAPPVLPASLMDGSVSAVVSDQNFDGATMAAGALDPVYQGRIDGVPLPNARLWDPGFALSAGALSSNNQTTSFSGNVGPAALTSIGLRLQFTLTPGDSASVTGIFNIVPVPGPAGLPILALFGAVAAGRRRRS